MELPTTKIKLNVGFSDLIANFFWVGARTSVLWRVLVMRHVNHVLEKIPLLRRQPSPQIQNGEFVEVFDDLSRAWQSWADRPHAELVEWYLKKVGKSSEGLAAGEIGPVLDGGNCRARNTNLGSERRLREPETLPQC